MLSFPLRLPEPNAALVAFRGLVAMLCVFATVGLDCCASMLCHIIQYHLFTAMSLVRNFFY